MKRLIAACASSLILGAGAVTVAQRVANPRFLRTPIGVPLAWTSAALAAVGSLSAVGSRAPEWSIEYSGDMPFPSDMTRACFANVLNTNEVGAVLAREIATNDPDLVVLAETDDGEWARILDEAFPGHQHRHALISPLPGASFSIVSRLPISGVKKT